jgi:hypothetical protein
MIVDHSLKLKINTMKKLFVIASLLFAGMAVNAQWYMGSEFDISAGQVKNDNGDKRTSEIGIGVYADIGKKLSDLWDFGVFYGGTVEFYKNHINDTKSESAHWLLSPYLRYSCFQMGKFELLTKGSLTFEGTKSYNEIGLRLAPVIAYNLSEHIALQANLNMFSGGLVYHKVKNGNATTSFNLAGNSNNVANLGNFKIGFIYKF